MIGDCHWDGGHKQRGGERRGMLVGAAPRERPPSLLEVWPVCAATPLSVKTPRARRQRLQKRAERCAPIRPRCTLTRPRPDLPSTHSSARPATRPRPDFPATRPRPDFPATRDPPCDCPPQPLSIMHVRISLPPIAFIPRLANHRIAWPNCPGCGERGI